MPARWASFDAKVRGSRRIDVGWVGGNEEP